MPLTSSTSSSPNTSPRTIPLYLTLPPVVTALRWTIEAVTRPPNSSRSSASAVASAESEDVDVATDTNPSPSTIPSGVSEVTLLDAESSPEARTRATRPRSPVITAAVAEAFDVLCAGADVTTNPATSATSTSAAKVRTGTQRVCQTVPSARRAFATVRASCRTQRSSRRG